MKKIISFALICLTMLVQSAFVDAQDGDKYAMAEELLTLMKMQSNIEESFSMVKNLVMSQSVMSLSGKRLKTSIFLFMRTLIRKRNLRVSLLFIKLP